MFLTMLVFFIISVINLDSLHIVYNQPQQVTGYLSNGNCQRSRNSSKYFVKIFKPDYKQVFYTTKSLLQQINSVLRISAWLIYVFLYVNVCAVCLLNRTPTCALILFYNLSVVYPRISRFVYCMQYRYKACMLKRNSCL